MAPRAWKPWRGKAGVSMALSSCPSCAAKRIKPTSFKSTKSTTPRDAKEEPAQQQAHPPEATQAKQAVVVRAGAGPQLMHAAAVTTGQGMQLVPGAPLPPLPLPPLLLKS